MAAEADQVIVELIAKNDQFDATVQRSAANYKAGMTAIETAAVSGEKAHTRLTASVGNSRIAMLEFQHIARGTADQLAAGAPLTQIFAQHLGMITQAATLAGDSLGVLGRFIGNPYVQALLLAGTAIVALIARHKEEGDAVSEALDKLEKHHRQLLANDEAQRIYDRTVEGSVEAMKKLTDEIDKQNLTLEDNIQLKKAAIAASLANVATNIGTVSADIAKAVSDLRAAQHELELAQSGQLGGENPAATLQAAQAFYDQARQRVADLTAQLISLNAAANGGAKALRSVDFPLFERDAKAAANPIDAINLKFDKMADAAKKAGTYTRQLANDIEAQRAAAIKAARDTGGSGEFGRTMSFDAAAAIARGAGLNVTSAYRSTADQARLYNDPNYNRPGNPVARPGTSAHEGINGKWALDIAFAPGLTAQSLKKLYGDQGVTLSAVFKEAGHFHIEGRRTEGEIDADRAAAKAAADQQKALDAMSRTLADNMGKEQLVVVAKENQAELSREILANQTTLDDMIKQGLLPSLKDWEKMYEQIKASQEELNRFGEQMINDIFNPDNWRSWGDLGKTILRDLEAEFLKLAAINPLKNLLFGQNNPTLGSIFGSLGSIFGGGGGLTGFGLSDPTSLISTSGGIPHFAGGGSVSAGKPIVVGEQGQELFVPSSAGTIVPNGQFGASRVSVLIVPSPYFDGRVLEVSGPVIAQASVASANGGAALGRRNLARESLHRLD